MNRSFRRVAKLFRLGIACALLFGTVVPAQALPVVDVAAQMVALRRGASAERRTVKVEVVAREPAAFEREASAPLAPPDSAEPQSRRLFLLNRALLR